MDKQNYTIREIKKQEIKKYFEKIRKKLEKKLSRRKLIKRKRVIKNYRIIIRAVFLFITEELSFQRLSDRMACEYEISMSDTAWRKQILKIAPDFLEVAKECEMESRGEKKEKHYYGLDATNISIQGKKDEYYRIHTQYEIEEGSIKYAKITDKYIGESITHFPIEEGSIYLADRAYGKSKQLEYIIENKGGFIVRISPFQIRLFKDCECKEKLDLCKKIEGERFTEKCYIKDKEKIVPIRIIGIKKPEEKQKEAEKKTKRKARRKQYEASEKAIEFSKWFIVATSMNVLDTEDEIAEIYRKRWQIELLFKRMKTLLNLRSIRRSDSLYSKSIVDLWLSVGLIICTIQKYLTSYLHCCMSNFNIFSFIKYNFS